MLPITTTLAAVFALILVWLSFKTISLRVKSDIADGDGGNEALRIAVRSHGNFTEHAPLALILIGLLEYMSAPSLLLWALAGILIVARLLHPIGMGMKAPNFPRIAGVLGTQAALIVGAAYALYMTWL